MVKVRAVFDEDFGELMGGSPKKRFYEIVYQANRNLVEEELDLFMRRSAAMEMILDEVAPDWEKRLRSRLVEEGDALESLTANNYIELMGSIVSKNE